MQENASGYSHFIRWDEVLDPENGYISDDTITLEVHIFADAPRGVFGNNKKHTGNRDNLHNQCTMYIVYNWQQWTICYKAKC